MGNVIAQEEKKMPRPRKSKEEGKKKRNVALKKKKWQRCPQSHMKRTRVIMAAQKTSPRTTFSSVSQDRGRRRATY